MDDGILDEDEAQRLNQIASSVGSTLGEFVATFFRSEGEGFLRGIFAACTEGSELSQDAWAKLTTATSRLGLSHADLINAIRPQAERFVEHVLADAKSDGELSEREEATLTQLVRTLKLSSQSTSYIQKTIEALRTIRLARKGQLPSIGAPAGIAVRAGEIVHLQSRAAWIQKRMLKSGVRKDEHYGTITITDNRILFSSDTKSFDIRFPKVIGHAGDAGVILLQRAEKPECIIRVDEEEPIAYAIFEAALALANQTRMTKVGGTPSRHIPRDVRQRVWQRYGGRCAECGAAHYLEFDHIVPVAKGGSNSDANVQLLCRGCNLRKSDLI
jgi:hypothetical protein